LSTEIFSAYSESIFLSFFESIDGCSRCEESLGAAVGEGPIDFQVRVSLVPLNFELSVHIGVGPGKIERSNGRES